MSSESGEKPWVSISCVLWVLDLIWQQRHFTGLYLLVSVYNPVPVHGRLFRNISGIEEKYLNELLLALFKEKRLCAWQIRLPAIHMPRLIYLKIYHSSSSETLQAREHHCQCLMLNVSFSECSKDQSEWNNARVANNFVLLFLKFILLV